MKHRHSAILLLLAAALLRCTDAEPPPRPKGPLPQKPELLHARGPDDSAERTNLLNVAHGAVAVSRTGEASLENSAVCAIDGDPSTAWLSPPDEPDQSLVFRLPARSHLTALGVQMGADVNIHPKTVHFAVSADGRKFTDAASFANPPGGTQFVDTNVEATYVRFSTQGGHGSFVRAFSVLARGDLLEPVRPGSLDGCWSINGLDSTFIQRGASVTGVMNGKDPIAIDGGSDGRFYRLLWIRGPEYGIVDISVTPDAQHLSGLFWHEEAYSQFLTAGWFGEKSRCRPAPTPAVDMLTTFMDRYGRYPMYGLQFDDAGRLMEPPSEAALTRLVSFLRGTASVKIVAHELMQTDAARNQAISQMKIDSLRTALQHRGVDLNRVQFEAVGADNPHRPAATDAIRAVYGAVELIKP
ncbi:MAG: discoidin domain-containing protein [Thermoanaerobaculia bacterium]